LAEGKVAASLFRGHSGAHISVSRVLQELKRVVWGANIFPHHLRNAGGTGGLHGLWFCMKPDRTVDVSGSLVDFQSRERNGAFGPDARVGEKGRGSADGTKSAVE